MKSLLTFAIIGAALLPAAAALVSACSDPEASTPDARAAQERFQREFCYKQYRSQSDITRCLANRV
jgi:hypothetical protein